MYKISLTSLFLIFILSCNALPVRNSIKVQSPSKNIEVAFQLLHDGTPTYIVDFNDERIIDTSRLGFDFKRIASIKNNFKIVNIEQNSFSETWEMPWGETKEVINNYNEIIVTLQNSEIEISNFVIHFRVYDDGIGFRYEFPQLNDIDSITILDENTEFNLTGNHTTWWIPGDWDIYEHLYSETKFTDIDALSKANHSNLAQTYIPENAVNTPVTMRTVDGIHLSFHEANLTNYPGMTLKIEKDNLLMKSGLVGSQRLGYKAKVELPFKTPWRTIQITKKATELIDSKLIVNLNEPNRLGDVSWFKPTKYMGIWWEMHVGKSQWSYTRNGKPHGEHGATTENAKEFIDFASANGIGSVLVEGWNTGWEHWIGFEEREGVFDFVTSYPDYDLEEVVRYGREKGVEIIMHHETSAAPRTYEQQLDTAFALMQRLGIHSVKTGYVGKIIPKGEFHHGQWMVNHFRKVIETAAKYEIAINAHEPIKATGIRRTYPNAITREGLRGQEFNAWASDGGNPPNHLPTVAFTRMLAGPIDFTPGVFNIKLEPYKKENQINTTLAHQLALYVVIYSPLQMACDLIVNYENQPAFQFISDVGVDWEKSITLNGEVGEFVTIAREEKNSGKWFLGSITNEEARSIKINFEFLNSEIEYEATIYKDGENAHWNDNPTEIEISKMKIDNGSIKEFKLAPGGGIAISLIPIKD
ncbi:MAG: glycoside hydrolase family 97 protein [Melioribacteraceae bacterium]|nr:glycoside hydrolase family 97 protein [Melioribacteraceae bacterium]